MSVKMKDLGWNDIKKQVLDLNNTTLKVGLMTEKIASIGYWNEYGTRRGIPSRPFMRQSVNRYWNKWQYASIRMYNKIIESKGKFGIGKELKTIGALMKSNIQNQILNGDYVPNAISTIRKKGSSRPLVDTGRMVRSIEYEVNK